MELSPRIYHKFVRPKWFTKFYVRNKILKEFDFGNKKILDFGCGVGSNCTIFEPFGYLGIDIDAGRIEYAQQLHPNYSFRVLKDSRLPIEDNSIDYILIMSVLHHIPVTPLPHYLKEFQRIVKDSGQILVVEPCFYADSCFCNMFMSFLDKGEYIRKEDEYLRIFAEQNYNVKVLKKFNQLYLYNKLFFIATPSGYS